MLNNINLNTQPTNETANIHTNLSRKAIRPVLFSDLPKYQRILLLQGPIGPFFNKLSRHLESSGAEVTKINFNPGDDHFFPPNNDSVIQYKSGPSYWPTFLSDFICRNQIDAVFLFGDCREYHTSAREIARSIGVDVWVFEEGYIRPNFFTLEKNGVNYYSKITTSRFEQIIKESSCSVDIEYSSASYEKAFWYMVKYSMIYWFVSLLLPFRYKNYIHHRPLNLIRGYGWVKNFIYFWIFRVTEKRIKQKILSKSFVKGRNGNYFLMPLQVHDDAQVTVHSDYDSIEGFIQEVLTSFASHIRKSKSNDVLIIKHHPMDRGSVNYSSVIFKLAKLLGISSHVAYVHDIRLPSIMPIITGCITINSTFGLQALYHRVPTINLGRSFYNKPELCFQGSLDDFWAQKKEINFEAIRIFRNYLIQTTQVNGSLYSPKYLIR